MIYETKDGEVLDEIVFRHYGKTAGMVELVLSNNRHLADKGPVYKANVRIVLPDVIDRPEVRKEISIWD